MKGRGLLRSMGIVMIIAGAIQIVFCASLVFIIFGLTTFGVSIGFIDPAQAGIFMIIAAILTLAGGVIEFIAGIVGTHNAGRPERYKRCFVWGLIVLIINVISLILTLIGGQYNMIMVIIAAILGILIPLLFIIGALMNRSAAAKGVSSVDWAQERVARAEKKYEKEKHNIAKLNAKREAKLKKMQEVEAAKAAKAEAQAQAEAQRIAALKKAEEEKAAQAAGALYADQPVVTAAEISANAADKIAPVAGDIAAAGGIAAADVLGAAQPAEAPVGDAVEPVSDVAAPVMEAEVPVVDSVEPALDVAAPDMEAEAPVAQAVESVTETAPAEDAATSWIPQAVDEMKDTAGSLETSASEVVEDTRKWVSAIDGEVVSETENFADTATLGAEEQINKFSE